MKIEFWDVNTDKYLIVTPVLFCSEDSILQIVLLQAVGRLGKEWVIQLLMFIEIHFFRIFYSSPKTKA